MQWCPLLSPLWSCRDLQSLRLAVVGDLHLVPDQMPTFQAAQQHLNDALLGSQHSSNGTGSTGRPVGRLVQLGDLGGYEVRPGMLPSRMPSMARMPARFQTVRCCAMAPHRHPLQRAASWQ